MVQWVSVDEPPVLSDHQRVRLHFQDDTVSDHSPRGSVVLHTPSDLRSLLRVITELVVDLIAEGVGHNATAATWDVTARPCVHCIRRVRKRAGQRRKAVVRRLQAQSRARLLTRKELLAVTFEEAREEHLARLGSR